MIALHVTSKNNETNNLFLTDKVVFAASRVGSSHIGHKQTLGW